MTDKIAASILARLLAKGLLVGIWVPPQEIRELRGLVAQRQKMTRLATQAKNRLHAVIQRHHLMPPEGNPFAKTNNSWWESLALGRLEKMNLQSDLETLQFAGKQVARLQEEMTGIAAENEEIGRLLHISGFGVITAVTVYAAIGDISRFEDAEHLVGYAGMGTRVHDSGLTTRTGKMTKAGRRDLRVALVEAASTLEGGTGATGTALGTEQSDRGDRARVIGYRLACVSAQGGGPFCRTRKGIEKDAALRL